MRAILLTQDQFSLLLPEYEALLAPRGSEKVQYQKTKGWNTGDSSWIKIILMPVLCLESVVEATEM